MTEEHFTAWHFARDDRTLGNRDGREVKVGVELWVDGDLSMWHHGFHWSRRAIDALHYARGTVICKVIPLGQTIEIKDRGVSQGIKVIWIANCDDIMKEFSRWCALQVVHLWHAHEGVLQYLDTGDERLKDAALTAAWDGAASGGTSAARCAARAVVWDGAWAVAKCAARAFAWNATRSFAWNTTRAAAWDDALDDAMEAQNTKLTGMINLLRRIDT